MKFWREKILNVSSYKRKKNREKQGKICHCGWQKLLVRDEGKNFKPTLLGVSWAKARAIDGD